VQGNWDNSAFSGYGTGGTRGTGAGAVRTSNPPPDGGKGTGQKGGRAQIIWLYG
jgi:hypothetical protein